MRRTDGRGGSAVQLLPSVDAIPICLRDGPSAGGATSGRLAGQPEASQALAMKGMTAAEPTPAGLA
eukprot:15477526-Alexandrium_andersonii.AAC.1